MPAELARRTDFSGLSDGSRLALAFVEPTLFGPRVVGVPPGTLVLTDDWWVYNAALAALNCPRLSDCPVLFGLAPNSAEVDRLRAEFPDRTLMRAVEDDGTVTVVPYS
jgi:hypothetical protein